MIVIVFLSSEFTSIQVLSQVSSHGVVVRPPPILLTHIVGRATHSPHLGYEWKGENL
jgi:hypothetical protein